MKHAAESRTFFNLHRSMTSKEEVSIKLATWPDVLQFRCKAKIRLLYVIRRHPLVTSAVYSRSDIKTLGNQMYFVRFDQRSNSIWQRFSGARDFQAQVLRNIRLLHSSRWQYLTFTKHVSTVLEI